MTNRENSTTRNIQLGMLYILATILFGLAGMTTTRADDDHNDRVRSSTLTISRAVWDAGEQRLRIEGDKNRRATVTVVNAFDVTQVIGSDNDTDDRDWRVRVRSPNPVPCRVRATSSDGQIVERDVSRAPANCAPRDNNQQQVCNIAVAPTTLAFGDVTVGNVPILTTTVSNSGTAACTGTLALTGSNDFATTAPAIFSVAPGGSQSIPVSYTPGTTGADTGNLAVSSNDLNNAIISVSLTGNGVQQQVQECNITVSPTTLAFGDITVGNTPTLSTTVSNSGTAACNVNLVRSGSSDFAISSAASFSVAPGGSASVSVSYTPGQAGTDTGTVAVNSNDPDTATVSVSLTGNGVQQQVQECNITVSPTTLAFGDITVGNTPTLSTTVSNSGAAACNVNLVRSGSSDFAISSAASFSVAPGGSASVSVSYTPGQAGTDTGTVAVNSNDPDTATVSVSLTGNGVQQQVQCNPAFTGTSINSTSQSGCPDVPVY